MQCHMFKDACGSAEVIYEVSYVASKLSTNFNMKIMHKLVQMTESNFTAWLCIPQLIRTKYRICPAKARG